MADGHAIWGILIQFVDAQLAAAGHRHPRTEQRQRRCQRVIAAAAPWRLRRGRRDRYWSDQLLYTGQTRSCAAVANARHSEMSEVILSNSEHSNCNVQPRALHSYLDWRTTTPATPTSLPPNAANEPASAAKGIRRAALIGSRVGLLVLVVGCWRWGEDGSEHRGLG